MLHYVHRRLVFLTSGEVGADPAVRTSTATTSLPPEGRRAHHSYRSPFRYVFFQLHRHWCALLTVCFSLNNQTWGAFVALSCRISAASRFNQKMLLPSFDCHTLGRCSTVRTPISPVRSVAYMHDHRHKNRTHLSHADQTYCTGQTFTFPPACHSRSAGLSYVSVLVTVSTNRSYCICRFLSLVRAVLIII